MRSRLAATPTDLPMRATRCKFQGPRTAPAAAMGAARESMTAGATQWHMAGPPRRTGGPHQGRT
eukprot:2980059-Alexandrium_andersonii.AAC.1